MNSSSLALSAWSYGLAGLAYAALALYLARIGYWRMRPTGVPRLLLAAVAASALWGWLGLADQFSKTVFFMRTGALADLFSYACWFAFLLALLRPQVGDKPGSGVAGLKAVAAAAAATCLLLQLLVAIAA